MSKKTMKIIMYFVIGLLVVSLFVLGGHLIAKQTTETLGSILFFVIGFAWMVYLTQEMFITGASALNMSVAKDEGERKQIQVSSGLHFDGIEVWLVGALTLLFGAFPLAFTTTLTHLYIPFFLVIYAIIARGLSIEFLYKLDNSKWLKSMKITWTVSSILIMLLLGVYLTNIFYGFPLGTDGMTEGFFSIFNVTGIAGGLLFVLLSLVSGAGWIYLSTSGELGLRAVKFIKKVGIIYAAPVVLLLVFMGFNNTKASLFIGELFTAAPILFALPLLTVFSALGITWFGYKEDGKKVFIFALLTMAMFLITGFVGMYPYMIPSHVLVENGITLYDAAAFINSQIVIVIAVMIFFPIIIGYQTWKYIRFTTKVNYNDE